ncbi:hypothetical protein RF819_03205 [Rhodoferax fermentans]|uniref:Antirepressor protein C-terminal domain-containing protein n=2 Tax=Rhodoferax fermentans TaxID=28066 RepID=A0A1T1ANZ9_RHOFE|nr:hypothetical protein RF819_03205 [Rhodoferax fermentans]
MGSQELASLTQTRHDSVKRTIETLAQKGAVKQLPQIVEVTNHLGQRVQEYHLNQRDTMVVVARLNPQFMARVVDRWMELEAKQAPDTERVAQLEAALLRSNPQWVQTIRLRGAGLEGWEIARVLEVSRTKQEKIVRAIRAAGLGHLLPATAKPPVGHKLAAAPSTQMALEV